MKTYEPRRNNACPNGLHPDYNPELDPSLNECTCPWLIIQSSTPVQHLTSWNRRELDNAIREFDNGYFDPPGYPRRERSMFLSAPMQRLLDVAQKEPVAAALTLLAGSGSGLAPFDAIAWDAEDAVLSLRSGAAGGWRRLWLGHANVETVTDQSKTPGGVAPVLLWAEHPDTAAETGLPEGLVATPHEPAQDYFAEDITGTAPLVFEVPADQLGEMRAGNPMFDELMQRATDENAGGLVFIPAELASGGAISQGVALVGEDGRVSGFDAVREGMATLPRLEDVPLPQRVPQVPSDIATSTWRYADAEQEANRTQCGGVMFGVDVNYRCGLPAVHSGRHEGDGAYWTDPTPNV